MLDLVLYETSHCYLCEQAHALLMPYVEHGICRVELIDVASEEVLMETYGESIPVLNDVISGRHLHWPFDREALDGWLRSCVSESRA